MSPTAITGWGAALPSRTLDNAELAGRLGLDEDWIFQRTGIRSRRVVGPGETTSSLSVQAGRAALRQARLRPEDIDLVIVATFTPDRQLPQAAASVQAELGCVRAGAFDLNAGCAGFLYALAQAHSSVEAGLCDRVLVCGADVLSTMTDPSDPSSCILFGDGAGAVIVERDASGIGMGPFILRSDGSAAELLCIPRETGMIHMRGREVYRHAVDGMASALREVVAGAHLALNDIDLVVVHQANARIVEAVVARLGLDPGKVMLNIGFLGNTSAASIPLALAQAADEGRLRAGDVVAFAAFGAGFAWGACLAHWVAPRTEPREGSSAAIAPDAVPVLEPS